DKRNMAMLFISHDLGVVARVADHVLVMFRGKTMEYGKVRDVLESPQAGYTRGLLSCRPPLSKRPKRLRTVRDVLENIAVDTSDMPYDGASLEAQKPLLEIRDLEKWFSVGSTTILSPKKRVFKALNGINAVLYPGETLGLVGESGSGKSTLSRCLVRLY